MASGCSHYARSHRTTCFTSYSGYRAVRGRYPELPESRRPLDDRVILNGVPLPSPSAPARRRRLPRWLRIPLTPVFIVWYICRSRKGRVACILVGAVLVAAVSWSVAWETHQRTETCVVTQRKLVAIAWDRSGDPTEFDRRVFTTGCGVFSVDDDPMRFRWDTNGAFSAIEPGATCQFTVVGWKGELFSTIPNIIGEACAD